MAIAPPRPPIASACAELAADIGELAWIARDQARRAHDGGNGTALDGLGDEARADAAALEALARAVRAGEGEHMLDSATARRAAFAQGIRQRQAILAGALVAASWQSPSIRHAHCAQAGPAEGRVIAHHDDYARDRHPAGAAYERALAATRSQDASALLTSCGMSAVVVALAHIQSALQGPVVLGASTYHETRDLVLRAAPHAEMFDEHPDDALVGAILRVRPGCVILDAVATEHGASVPDLNRVAWALGRARAGAWLVIDMTGAPLAAAPLPDASGVQVLVIESLTKHAQLGLDRVTAGAIYASPGDLAALDARREHLGANIADASVHALPTPQRAVLARRLARHARNAGALAHDLAAAAPGAEVAHPALATHPAHDRLPATWLTLRLGTPERAEAFVANALAFAEAGGIALAEGASFGFDSTRIYAPSPGEQAPCGFVRISAGIEHSAALARLSGVLVRALRDA